MLREREKIEIPAPLPAERSPRAAPAPGPARDAARQRAKDEAAAAIVARLAAQNATPTTRAPTNAAAKDDLPVVPLLAGSVTLVVGTELALMALVPGVTLEALEISLGGAAALATSAFFAVRRLATR